MSFLGCPGPDVISKYSGNEKFTQKLAAPEPEPDSRVGPLLSVAPHEFPRGSGGADPPQALLLDMSPNLDGVRLHNHRAADSALGV